MPRALKLLGISAATKSPGERAGRAARSPPEPRRVADDVPTSGPRGLRPTVGKSSISFRIPAWFRARAAVGTGRGCASFSPEPRLDGRSCGRLRNAGILNDIGWRPTVGRQAWAGAGGRLRNAGIMNDVDCRATVARQVLRRAHREAGASRAALGGARATTERGVLGPGGATLPPRPCPARGYARHGGDKFGIIRDFGGPGAPRNRSRLGRSPASAPRATSPRSSATTRATSLEPSAPVAPRSRRGAFGRARTPPRRDRPKGAGVGAPRARRLGVAWGACRSWKRATWPRPGRAPWLQGGGRRCIAPRWGDTKAGNEPRRSSPSPGALNCLLSRGGMLRSSPFLLARRLAPVPAD